MIFAVQEELDTVYAKLFATAEENVEENVRDAEDRAGILGTLGQHSGYVRTPWCGDEACEEAIGDQMAAEIVMVPFPEDEEKQHAAVLEGDADCAVCGDDADETAYFAKSY